MVLAGHGNRSINKLTFQNLLILHTVLHHRHHGVQAALAVRTPIESETVERAKRHLSAQDGIQNTMITGAQKATKHVTMSATTTATVPENQQGTQKSWISEHLTTRGLKWSQHFSNRTSTRMTLMQLSDFSMRVSENDVTQRCMRTAAGGVGKLPPVGLLRNCPV